MNREEALELRRICTDDKSESEGAVKEKKKKKKKHVTK